jgi:AcrR family transcriptional regulator
MPRAWNKKEKEAVKKSLLEEGQKLFEKYGLRKTTLDEIVKAARISKGAFYFFYASKEELYFEILDIVEHGFKDDLYRIAFQSGISRKESFKNFLHKMINFMTTTPMFRQINSEDFQYLIHKLPPTILKKHMKRDQEYVTQYFDSWIKKGWMRKVDMKALNGLLLSLVYFVIHRDDLGGAEFNASKNLFIDMLTEYLIPEEENQAKA